MATIYVVPVFNVGGYLVRNEAGDLVYAEGRVEKFEEMDIDHVNFGDLVKLYESLGFVSHQKMHWLDKNAVDFEAGLYKLDGDNGIHDMCHNLMVNIGASNEFHIYVEHSIDVPIPAPAPDPAPAPPPAQAHASAPASNIDLQDTSGDDGYESAEDEVYKPPPYGYEGDSDSDESMEVRGRGKGKKK
ncbi:hypothetical protein PIB30_097552, partial [Stylosanthes scabra]|nr:hypothetical protein [Stylosanthes scabra]